MTMAALGVIFAHSVAEKDWSGVAKLLHPDIDFRAMTPNRVWDGANPAEVLATLDTWFEVGDVIESVESVESDAFVDRERVGYRFRVRNDNGLHEVEQQAYLSVTDGQISWLRIMCSGFRLVPDKRD